VFADGESDQSVIVEINSFEDSVKDEEIAAYYFSDLAETNGALSAKLLAAGRIDNKLVPAIAE
jgi:hypothetical protein